MNVEIEILEAIVTDLNTDRPTSVPEVTKRRFWPGDVPSRPSMGIFLGDESVDPPRGRAHQDSLARRRIAVAIQCIGITDDAEEIDASVADMLDWAIVVLGRSRLDGKVHEIRETSTSRRSFYADRYFMDATTLFEISYQTLRDDRTRRV